MIAFNIQAPTGISERAQTRTETIMLEGIEEEITTTRYDSEYGYAIWLDAERYELLPGLEGSDADVYAPIGTGYEIIASLSIRIQNYGTNYSLNDELRALYQEYDAHGLNNYDWYEMELKDDFLSDYEVMALGATGNGRSYELYVIGTDTKIYSAVIDCSVEAAEGHGARLSYMLSSFEAL
jgi:hypothetical protein